MEQSTQEQTGNTEQGKGRTVPAKSKQRTTTRKTKSGVTITTSPGFEGCTVTTRSITKEEA